MRSCKPNPASPSTTLRVVLLPIVDGEDGVVTTVFIDGAHGTTGLEIRERLAARPEFTLATLPHDRRRDPAARAEALNDADLAILCLPDEAAMEAMGLIRSNTKVIDASSAHRTAPGWTYGLPEMVGEAAIAASSRVSNPGCYPTGFLLLVAPLVAAGVLSRDARLSVHAVSGYSGGGRALIERFESDPTLAWRGYAYAGEHKHLAEMRVHAGLTHAPLFSPAVVRAFRGMMVEVPLVEVDAPAARAALEATYADEPGVTLAGDADELLLHEGAAGHDRATLHLFPTPDGRAARAVALLDNLGKGAAGAAVRNLELMVGG